MSETSLCVAGCKHFSHHESRHHKDCTYYSSSFTKYRDMETEELKREVESLKGLLSLAFNNAERLINTSDEFWVIDRHIIMELRIILHESNSRKHTIEKRVNNEFWSMGLE